jgi:isoleucyl-tRNA synthetase
VSSGAISIDLDCELDDQLRSEGLAREIVNRVQRSRKELGLHVADRIRVAYDGDPSLLESIGAHADYIRTETLAVELEQRDPGAAAIDADVGGLALRYGIEKT